MQGKLEERERDSERCVFAQGSLLRAKKPLRRVY